MNAFMPAETPFGPVFLKTSVFYGPAPWQVLQTRANAIRFLRDAWSKKGNVAFIKTLVTLFSAPDPKDFVRKALNTELQPIFSLNKNEKIKINDKIVSGVVLGLKRYFDKVIIGRYENLLKNKKLKFSPQKIADNLKDKRMFGGLGNLPEKHFVQLCSDVNEKLVKEKTTT